MSEVQASIGRVKREISQLVNRVAFDDDRIVLTSRGKPKAVIVSLEDYERIQQTETQAHLGDFCRSPKKTISALRSREQRVVHKAFMTQV
jgi:prevent-host-death family protein